MVEVRVDRSRVDDVPRADALANPKEIDSDFDADARMVEYPLEHARIAVERHMLERVGEVAVVVIRARRHPGRDGGR